MAPFMQHTIHNDKPSNNPFYQPINTPFHPQLNDIQNFNNHQINNNQLGGLQHNEINDFEQA